MHGHCSSSSVGTVHLREGEQGQETHGGVQHREECIESLNLQPGADEVACHVKAQGDSGCRDSNTLCWSQEKTDCHNVIGLAINDTINE